MPRREEHSWKRSLDSAISGELARLDVGTARDDRDEAQKFFETYCRIRTIEKTVIPFKLNGAQHEFHQDRTGRDIVSKARKRGISTYTESDFYRQVSTVPNTAAAVVAHKPDSVQDLWKIVQLLYRRDPRKLKLTYSSRRELFFAELNSYFVVLQAGEGSGRSGTYNFLHVSELAHFPSNALEVVSGMMASVPPPSMGSQVVIESTSNGEGNEYHRRWLDAVAGRSEYTAHFFPWFEQPEYVRPWEGGGLTDEEERWRRDYGLSQEQIQFYRAMRREYGSDLVKQEYPFTWQESFLASGRKALDTAALEVMEREHARQPILIETYGPGAYLKVWKQPERGRRYFAGGDTSEGVHGGDYQDFRIYDFESGDEVVALRGFWPFHVFARKIAALSKRYRAFTTIERNNHGHAILEHLTGHAKDEVALPQELLYYHQDYDQRQQPRTRSGWPTDNRTRPIMIADLQEAVRLRSIIPHDETWYAEARALAYNAVGKAEAPSGMHDDAVFATMIALQGRKVYSLPLPSVQRQERLF